MMLEATKVMLSGIKERVSRGRLKDERKIALAVGKVINKFKVQKHFSLSIGRGYFGFAVNEDKVAQEAALDGIYVVETTVDPQRTSPKEMVEGYKSLRYVKRAFRTMKSMALELRPIYHRLADRVRPHVFLFMLAYILRHLAHATGS